MDTVKDAENRNDGTKIKNNKNQQWNLQKETEEEAKR